MVLHIAPTSGTICHVLFCLSYLKIITEISVPLTPFETVGTIDIGFPYYLVYVFTEVIVTLVLFSKLYVLITFTPLSWTLWHKICYVDAVKIDEQK